MKLMVFRHLAPLNTVGLLGRHFHALTCSLRVKMPKNKTNFAKLKHVKFKEARGGQFPLPSIIDIQVIGSGGKGTPQSIVIGTDHSNYLFNSGEGVQRISSEHKVRLSKVENIFFTHKSWKNIGGLLGLTLTLEGTNVPKVMIHGPSGVEDILKMVTGFSDSKTSIHIEKRNADSLYFEDSAFRIDYVELRKEPRNDRDRVKMEDNDETESNEPDKKKQKLDHEDICMAYVCKAHPTIRKIDFEKCVQAGITKPGPMIGKLKAGETVTLEDGTVIDPEQVLSPVEKNLIIIIVECPSKSFLNALISSEKLNQFDETDQPLLVVHMTPSHVLASKRYKKWIKRFDEKTDHLVLNESTSEICQLGLYSMQSQLNIIHPHIYPLLPHLTSPATESDAAADHVPVKACTNLKYHIRPHKGFNWDQCLKLDRAAYVEEAMNVSTFADHLRDLKLKLDLEPTTKSDSYPEVVFLGTGSSIPSKRRNVSGILLHLGPDSCMFLDCGEGTAAQLYRYYGSETDSILQKVKAVFVSHLHADHHLGLFSILAERKRALLSADLPVTPLQLLAPIQISKWLQFYGSHVESIREELNLLPLQHIVNHQLQPENRHHYDLILNQLGLQDFRPVDVYHCRNAYGVAIKHKDGWKLVYSGDTMPCDKLVKEGKDCDLLIHEATMEDDLEEEARLKTHSTTSQAIDIGMKMRAKFVLLNHFSQRYAKIPFISESLMSRVGIAFDNMRVRLCDLHLLPLFNPVLKALFAEEHAMLEYKQMRRSLKKELLKKHSAKN